MSTLMTEDVAREARQRFEQLREPVRLLFFTHPRARGAGGERRELPEALVDMSAKLLVTACALDCEAVIEHDIDKALATVVRGETGHGIGIFGLTGADGLGPLIKAILVVSRGVEALDPPLAAERFLARSEVAG